MARNVQGSAVFHLCRFLVAKNDKMLGKPRILSLLLNSFNKFNNVRSSIYR